MKNHNNLNLSDYAKMHGRIVESVKKLGIGPVAAAEGLRLSFREYYSPGALDALLGKAQTVFNYWRADIVSGPITGGELTYE